MKIEMIAIDLDGTALRPDHVSVSRRLMQAMEQAHEQGIRIIPVTGRPFRLLPEFLKAHPIWESYGVLCNGAQIRDLRTEETLCHLTVPQEMLKKILEIGEDYDLPMEFNSDGELYLTDRSFQRMTKMPHMLFHCRALLPKIGHRVRNLNSCCDLAVEKVHVNGIPETSFQEVREKLSSLPISVVCERMPNLEITNENATKGQGLQTLCRMLEVSMDRVMAIGDSGNDLSMLETAGFSVAMGNAPAEVKAAADRVTGTNLEDGAAAAIEQYALS